VAPLQPVRPDRSDAFKFDTKAFVVMSDTLSPDEASDGGGCSLQEGGSSALEEGDSSYGGSTTVPTTETETDETEDGAL
jgi:hypothetical protein